ncbi:MAG: DUF4386 domain-containing protein [Thermoanaerobaculia bacterium]
MSSIQATARRAGALYFLFMIVGLVDMLGFAGFLVVGDATATARNIQARELVYRIGILTDLVALLLFIVLVVSLYHLLKGTDKWHAVLMVILVSVGVAVGLANLLTKIAPLILLRGADYLSVFSKPQLDALVLGLLSLNSEGNTVDAVFWGLWLFPFGILVVRSGLFPRVLGILLLVAGSAYLTSSVTSIVLPAYGDVVSRAATPLLLGEFPIIFWLLIKGAKVPQPEVRSV